MNATEKLEASLAIGRTKARYCRFLDTKDWDAYASLFTDDFELDVSEGSQLPVIRGREAALKQIQSSIGKARTAHQVHTPEIEFTSDDEARVIWAMQDRVVFDSERAAQVGIAGLTGYGHYHERYVRRGDDWKIAASRLTRLHLDLQRVSAA